MGRRAKRRLFALGALIVLGATCPWWGPLLSGWIAPSMTVLPGEGGLVAAPYLQLGGPPSGQPVRGLRVLWQTEDVDAEWLLEYRSGASDVARAAESTAVSGEWRAAPPPTMRTVRARGPGVLPHRVYRADAADLRPGTAFDYRLKRGGKVVWSGTGRAPKSADQPYRFEVFGDCGSGNLAARAIAYQAHRARPDLVVVPGDIVYSRGRIVEYHTRFFPIFNADSAGPYTGAPLLRSSLVVTAPGNHDTVTRDFNKCSDGLGYFLYWDQPLNGPPGHEGDAFVPRLIGSEADRAAFYEGAGPAYPRMANFSFDYANAHWTVLDSNEYVDWTAPELLAWLKRDLAAAQKATWRFVAMHHPPFSSSKAHSGDQRMRVLAELFEAGGVDIVWAGHVHNYQRTCPLKFRPDRQADGKPVRILSKVPGRFTLDTNFNGRDLTRPDGVIYITTGGGSARLYNPEMQDDPSSWQSYTRKFVSRVHSLTVVDVDGPRLDVRQITEAGREVDHFVVTKRAPVSPAARPAGRP